MKHLANKILKRNFFVYRMKFYALKLFEMQMWERYERPKIPHSQN